MSSVGPGRHPNFDITKFTPEHQRVLRRLENLFHLTRDGSISLGATSTYQYALIKPTAFLQSLLNTEREILAVFSPYKDFQPRTIDAFDRILGEVEDFRVEKIVRLLISDDLSIAKKIKHLFVSRPDAPVIIPFHPTELTLSTKDDAIFSRMREYTFSRDLFSMSSPLRNDLYFYGRSSLINEICAKLSSGENFGLFGLRRSGKTSIVHGVARALEARQGRSIVIDCSSPSIHQRRWNELLYFIVDNIKNSYGVSGSFHGEDRYTLKDAASVFLTDMRAIRGRMKVDFVALLFDEIERISFGTASSAHWSAERDSLLFWQAIRAGFQSEAAPYSYLMVGTNPAVVERIKLFESDNPLFGNVERRFIPMFTPQQVREMVDALGSVMGIAFDESAHARLFEDFGGHPFLTRYACSYVAKENQARPLLVDRTVYSKGSIRFKNESSEYVRSVVDMLENTYPDEHAMLKMLAVGDTNDFESLAVSDPTLVEHLIGYGVLGAGGAAHYYRIGVVEGYFEKEARPAKFLDQEARRTEISQKRNAIEQAMRETVRQCFTVHFPPKKRADELLKSLQSERRERLAGESFERLISPGESPLFFLELEAIFSSNWGLFQNMVTMPKDELRYHIGVTNKARADAHSRNLSDDELEKARVSLRELSRAFSVAS